MHGRPFDRMGVTCPLKATANTYTCKCISNGIHDISGLIDALECEAALWCRGRFLCNEAEDVVATAVVLAVGDIADGNVQENMACSTVCQFDARLSNAQLHLGRMPALSFANLVLGEDLVQGVIDDLGPFGFRYILFAKKLDKVQ
jgi:hypothetical protein